MNNPKYLYKLIVLFAWLASMPMVATAEETDGELRAPKLVEYVEAPYPQEALDGGLEAEVLASVSVDEQGLVTHVEIVEPKGHGFDEAASNAMKQFIFEPATRGGVPVASILVYRYTFFLERKEPEAPETEPEPPPVASISGTVRNLEEKPVPGALVVLTPIEKSKEADVGEEITLQTDEQGTFEADSIPAGTYRVEAIAADYITFSEEETLEAGENIEVIYTLSGAEGAYELVVRGKRSAREVTRQTVTTKEIEMIPGTGGDALRAIQNLPGMALTNFNTGELMIRGSAHADSVFFFDSINTPMLYHFGGMTSVLNTDLIEEINYYPGNFSVRYGRGTGGAVDVKTRAPKQDRFHGYIKADLTDGTVMAEGPINECWSIAASGRRSWIDGVIQAADLFGDDIQLTQAPRYYDFQLLADYHPHKKDNVKLFFYGSDDKWVMDWDDDWDPEWGGGLDLHIYTYQGQAEWKHVFNDEWENELSLSFGAWGVEDNEGLSMKQKIDVLPLLIRDELTWSPNKRATLRIGTDTELTWAFIKAHVPGSIWMEGEDNLQTVTDPAAEQWYDLDGTRFYVFPSAYSELDLNVIPRTQAILGVRGDYFGSVKRWSADPRLAIRYNPFGRTTLKGGVGMFHQAPGMEYADKEYGNPDLKLIRAMHYSLGVEQKILENLELSVEGFYKNMVNLLTRSDDLVERDGEMVPERFDNDGEGMVRGLEFQLRHNPTDRFFGWVAYTLMKSERIDSPGGGARPFDYDQTHVLTAVASLRLGWGVTAGLRFRLASGNPETPVIGSSYDADDDDYNPIYAATNSGRAGTFHQLDARLDKTWQWDHLALSVLLEVRNVYNRKNPVGTVYSYDFEEQGHFYDLPIFPNLGLKLEY